LQTYTFCSGDAHENRITKSKVLTLANRAAQPPPIFDESLMFRDTDTNSPTLKEDFRNRFRNVSRLMDCVGCDKCRLWGKVQTQGYGTALKVLFEYDEAEDNQNPILRRTELVALVNTLDRLSASLSAASKFARMFDLQKGLEKETGGAAADVSTGVNDSKRAVSGGSDDRQQNISPGRGDDFGDAELPSEDFVPEDPSVGDIFWHELATVTDAFWTILDLWYQIPGLM